MSNVNCAGCCIALFVVANAWAQGPVVATAGGRSIQESELNSVVGDRLMRLRTEEHALRISVLTQYLDRVLLSREAAMRGISVLELLQAEVDERIDPVTEAEAHAVLETMERPNGGPSGEQALRGAIDEIRRRRTAKRRSEFLASLRERYPTRIMLEQPRLTQPVGGGQRTGNTDALVSILIFSDFECPYCAALDVSLWRIANEYGSKIQFIAKQFPLSAHHEAETAAEAALCAADQGRYWEMSEVLFSNQNLITQGQFNELARRTSLEIQQFEKCMTSHSPAGEVARDIADARAAGVNSTPTIFINGMMFVGAKPYDALRETISAEIVRSMAAPK